MTQRLTRSYERCDLSTYTDLLGAMLANTENAFLQAQQQPGIDYTFRDIVNCTVALASSQHWMQKDLILEDLDRSLNIQLAADVSVPAGINFSHVENWNFEHYLKLLHFIETVPTKLKRKTIGCTLEILHKKFNVPNNKTGIVLTQLLAKFEGAEEELRRNFIAQKVTGMNT